MHRSFGWDLAAYGHNYSALCYGVQKETSFTATILKCKEICRPRMVMASDLRSVVDIERKMLESCCAIAEFIVDVPIDLGSLLKAINRLSCWEPEPTYYWQLVKRPVDQALGGLTPLADRIGFPVARLANVLRGLKANSSVELNRTLLETYPAANLELIRKNHEEVKRVYDKYRWSEKKIKRADKQSYKRGVARFQQSGWVAARKDSSDQCLADLINALGFKASKEGEKFNADEFDSIMCSLVGCFPKCTMSKDELQQTIRSQLPAGSDKSVPDDTLVPSGYRVLNKWPDNVSLVLEREEFDDFDALLKYLHKQKKKS